jgi:hypothetical protein
MIIENKQGNNILNGNEKRIAFAVNSEGVNDSGFAGMISQKFWRELAFIGETEIGTVLTKKVGGVEYFALCCHSLKNGWGDQRRVIKQCFDAIPGDEPVASISIGTGFVGVLSGAQFSLIKAGMEDSNKKIILY